MWAQCYWISQVRATDGDRLDHSILLVLALVFDLFSKALDYEDEEEDEDESVAFFVLLRRACFPNHRPARVPRFT